jgi:hypothetical protein
MQMKHVALVKNTREMHALLATPVSKTSLAATGSLQLHECDTLGCFVEFWSIWAKNQKA